MNELLSFIFSLSPALDTAEPNFRADQYVAGKHALSKMSGCFLVDYNYTETESLKPDYLVDKRVYDVNKNHSVKEWIYSEEISPNHIRLQHILFSTDLNGNFIEHSMLKHHAEDWEYNAPFLYEFVKPSEWIVKIPEQQNLWTRRITNLDDGLRYQCASQWDTSSQYLTWSCGNNFAPIPGRETRDMRRKDYNTLNRATKVIVYNQNWLERQENVKIIYQNDIKIPLAKEEGKNWYIRLNDNECSVAQNFIAPKYEYWKLLRETWSEVLNGSAPFSETTPPNPTPRYVKIWEIEKQAINLDLTNPEQRASVKNEILNVINLHKK
jgi:hypothetical protein